MSGRPWKPEHKKHTAGIHIRVQQEMRDAIAEKARKEETNESEIVRRAIEAYLSERVVYRSAVTGELVSAQFAEAHPDTTVREVR